MINSQLHDAIKHVYKTDTAFGLAIGWVPQRVHKLVYGEYIPKITEAVKICDVLGISIDDMANFF